MNTKEIVLPFDIVRQPQRILKAGPLHCIYENGCLRRIKYGAAEILKMIYPAIRDEQWATIPPTISNESIVEDDTRFQILYTALYKSGDSSYQTEVQIEGSPQGRISFSFKGKALSKFKKNRIGICVLHPIHGCAGEELRILHTNGEIENAAFPIFVSPHQPFKDIKEMYWNVVDGLAGSLSFTGDVFETEDQRNWTDSSYKTYSTPLDLAFPVELAAGQTLEQEVILSISGKPQQENNDNQELFEERLDFPRIGYNKGAGAALNSKEIELAEEIPFHQYRFEVNTSDPSWQQDLVTGIETANRLSVIPEIVLFFDEQDNAAIEIFLETMQAHSGINAYLLPVARSKNCTTDLLIRKIYPPLKKIAPGISIGYGSTRNFAELNRNRPQNDLFDFLNLPIYPQAHAGDSISIWENLENQADLIISARKFSYNKPIHISPVLFSRQADQRQHSYFAALWTLFTLQNLAEAHTITLHDLGGINGLVNAEGTPSPLCTLLVELAAFNPLYILRQYKEGLLQTDKFSVENEKGNRLCFRFANA